MIGGFELPTAGRIELRGRDVTLGPARQAAGQHGVPELRAVPPPRRRRERRRSGSGEGRREARDRRGGSARRSTSSTLTGYERRRPNQLSGGQQQRVALARALVNRPNVLLLDEPLGALDLKLRKQLQLELKRIQTEVGITFVYVTHDQEEALTMSDRIAVMHARPGRAARHARGPVRPAGDPLRRGLHRHDEPPDRRSIDRGRRRRPPGPAGSRRAAPRRPGARDTVELSVRPEAVELGGDDRRTPRASRGDGRAGRLPRDQLQYHVRTARRPRPCRCWRRRRGSGSRSAAKWPIDLAARRGARPRRRPADAKEEQT